MSRTVLPLHAEDISALARSLRGQLATCQQPPSHLEILNMLARGSGFRNFQHLRAQTCAQTCAQTSAIEELPSPRPTPAPPAVDSVKLKRLTRFFDDQARLLRWPGKFSEREPCLWVIWSSLPAKRDLNELEIKQLLNERHLFGDHALLRRLLCDYGLMQRSADCRVYRRVERQPPPEALALIRRLSGGQAA